MGGIAAGCDQFLCGSYAVGVVGIFDVRGADVAAVSVEVRTVDGGIPVARLPVGDAVGHGAHEVVVVFHVLQVEQLLQLGNVSVVVEDDVVHHVRQRLREIYAWLWAVLHDRVEVLVVVPLSIGDTGRRYRAPPGFGVQLSKEGDVSAGI